MKLLDDGIDIEGFFGDVAEAGARALMLDYDGTLAPFTVQREKAFPYPGVRQALDALMDTGGCRLVIVSGRGAHDLLPLLGLKDTPEIWGSHGWERLGPSGYEPPELPPGMAEALEGLAGWAGKKGLGERFERKPVGAAVHVRGLDPEAAGKVLAPAIEKMSEAASASGMELHEFDGGIELRPPGRDKGHTVRTVLYELGAGAVTAYLGDDMTDEDAFTAISGRGLGVLVRPELRQTAAKLWIRPPEELLWFLDRWAGACGGK